MRPGSDILHLSAAQPAGDLLAILRTDGFAARRLCVYEAIEANPLDLEWVAGSLVEVDAILVHSPRAGRHIAGWLSQQRIGWNGNVVCISPAAAKPFHDLGYGRVTIAARPTEAALIDVLQDIRDDDCR